VNTTSHVLEYAPPITVGRLPLFRTFLALCAACGIVANLRLITESVGWLRFGSRAYRDLSVNPKAYGRLIEPETIASLRAPYWLGLPDAAVPAVEAGRGIRNASRGDLRGIRQLFP
jgi:hypothetical protein